ncbi:helix-turn-helix domain-containing protein [Salipaludibacillus sp. HK11]|uniref:AraC family transcriptional regulator n=1 Tax=Salipaludibacillus sp. HK11 TaxID=3394320 RepID=UPI0039FBC1F9
MKKSKGFQSEKIYVLPDYLQEELNEHHILNRSHLTDIGFFPEATHHFRERKTGCDSHIMIYCSSGEGRVDLYKNQLIHIKSQTFFIIPANTPHTYFADSKNPWSIYWFHVRGTDVFDLIHSFNIALHPIQMTFKDTSVLIQSFNQCYDLIQAKSYSIPHHLFLSQTIKYLVSLVGISAQKNDGKGKKNAYIDEAIHYMENHIHTSISLEDLANSTRLSKQHLTQLFKEEIGFPPIDYFLRLKIQRACQLLDLTNDSIKEIAFMVGFNDPYYFSRMFKKIISHSPTEYRKTQKG